MNPADNEVVVKLIEANRPQLIRRFLDADGAIDDAMAADTLAQPELAASLNHSFASIVSWLRQPYAISSKELAAVLDVPSVTMREVDAEMAIRRLEYSIDVVSNFVRDNFNPEAAANVQRRLQLALATARMTMAGEFLQHSKQIRPQGGRDES